ncbi:MAG: hypothetical protein HY811_04555 [Planctomycetes bacterium]|nr:hypothetical protein [Planctomycetota bacterium]
MKKMISVCLRTTVFVVAAFVLLIVFPGCVSSGAPSVKTPEKQNPWETTDQTDEHVCLGISLVEDDAVIFDDSIACINKKETGFLQTKDDNLVFSVRPEICVDGAIRVEAKFRDKYCEKNTLALSVTLLNNEKGCIGSWDKNPDGSIKGLRLSITPYMLVRNAPPEIIDAF